MVRGVLKIIPRYGFASAWSELRQTPLHCASLRLSLYEQWSILVCQWPVLFEKAFYFDQTYPRSLPL